MNPAYDMDRWAKPRYEACRHAPMVVDGEPVRCAECGLRICGAGCGLCVVDEDMPVQPGADDRGGA